VKVLLLDNFALAPATQWIRGRVDLLLADYACRVRSQGASFSSVSFVASLSMYPLLALRPPS